MNAKHWNLKFFPLISLVLSFSFACSCSSSKDGPGYIGGDNGGIGTPPTVSIEDTVLVFQSGFEGYTRIVPYGESTNDDIVGYDPNLSNSSWNDLKKDEIKTVYFNYTGGEKSKRYAEIIDDPTNPGNNKVLHFWLGDYWTASENEEKARIQLEFHQINGGYKEFYQSVRVYLTEDFNVLKNYPGNIGWLTISEFWNNEWWDANEKYGFRVTLGIGKATGTGKDLHFIVNAENTNFIEIWNADNPNVKVPVGKWFTMEYHFKEGNRDTGRFYMAITPDGEEKQVICDVHNFTHNTTDPAPDGVTAYNPLKLYTSKEIVNHMKQQGKVLQIYWDDLKLWKKITNNRCKFVLLSRVNLSGYIIQ